MGSMAPVGYAGADDERDIGAPSPCPAATPESRSRDDLRGGCRPVLGLARHRIPVEIESRAGTRRARRSSLLTRRGRRPVRSSSAASSDVLPPEIARKSLRRAGSSRCRRSSFLKTTGPAVRRCAEACSRALHEGDEIALHGGDQGTRWGRAVERPCELGGPAGELVEFRVPRGVPLYDSTRPPCVGASSSRSRASSARSRRASESRRRGPADPACGDVVLLEPRYGRASPKPRS